MIIADIVLGIFLAAFIVNGWKKGFVETLGQFLGIVIGLLLARAWAASLASFIGWLVSPHWANTIAFLVIFALVERLVGWVVGFANTLFKVLTVIPFVTLIFSALGAVAGLIQGIAIIGSLRVLAVLAGLEGWYVAYLGGSAIATICEHWFDWVSHLFF